MASKNGDNCLTLKKMISKLVQIKNKHGEKIKVYFDTEAGTFNVHLIGIESIYYAGEESGFGEMVIMHPDVSKIYHPPDIRWAHEYFRINHRKDCAMVSCKHCVHSFIAKTHEDLNDQCHEHMQSHINPDPEV